MSETTENFEPAIPDHQMGDEPNAPMSGLVVNLEGFEGPIDLLLALARDQKVDLTKISVLALADQYLEFIHQAKKLRLEIAADYLVMAAWLAYLKSRLLLPVEKTEGEEPTAAEMANALQFQLQRLEGMRKAAETLFGRPLLGREVFPRGAPEGIRVITNSVYEASLFEMLEAYGSIQRRGKAETLTIEQFELFSVDDALDRLRRVLGGSPDWATLASFLPEDLLEGLPTRAAIAATFVASLELVRDGHAEIRQDQKFGPIYFRGLKEETPQSPDQTGGVSLED
jgi:segregation and condensation protein A